MRRLAASFLLSGALLAQAPEVAPPDILERLAKDQVDTAEDYLAAAKRLMGSARTGDLLQARELAVVAWLLGKPSPIVAQAEDAFLKSLGLAPRFAQGGPGTNLPTDPHRLDFLMDPLSPRQDARLIMEQRLMKAWWSAEPDIRQHNTLLKYSQAARDQELSANLREKLLQIYQTDTLHTPADLLAAAKVLTRSKDIGDLLLANELAALAAFRGEPMSRILFAQTWDRVLRALDQPARYGTLGSQTMAPDVAPGVIRNLGYSGRPTSR